MRRAGVRAGRRPARWGVARRRTRHRLARRKPSTSERPDTRIYRIDFWTITLGAEEGSSTVVGGRLDVMAGPDIAVGPGARPGWQWDVALSFAGAQRHY